MTPPKMSIPPVKGTTPLKRFENALKAILAVPKSEVEKKREKAKKPKR